MQVISVPYRFFLLLYTLGDSGFFRLQGIKVLWRLRFLEYLRTLSLKFQKAQTEIEVVLSLDETANRADSGQLQFWSEPSEILNLRSLNTPETVTLIPWSLKHPESPKGAFTNYVYKIWLFLTTYPLCLHFLWYKSLQQVYLLTTYQSYIYQVLQTIQMKLILLCVWAEPAVLGSAKTALKFIYKI